MHIFCRTFAIVMFMLPAVTLLAEESKTPGILFQDVEILEATLTAPLTTLVKERPKENYLPGVFQYAVADGTAFKLDIEIRTRGHFRHNTCDFPPLSLNFKKSQTDGTLFDKQKKLKLVVHCDDSKRYEQIVLREYLAYRIYNAITNTSFRVRLLRVTYVDNEERRKEQVRYAFLIEHKNRLAKRYDMKDLEVERTTIAAIQPDRLNLTSVFQYLIGNTDFSPIAGPPGGGCCHNYVLFQKDTDPLVAIPYDFDQAGFVDAPYASPNENLRIRTVRQRLYRGRCNNNQHIAASVDRIKDNRDAIYALVSDQEGLNPRVRKTLLSYIDKFYKVIDDPKKVEKQITKKCI
jgi:hypothetical protein